MLAALVKEFGPPAAIVVEEVDDLTPGPGEVLIEVAAASVNFPDLLVVDGTYQHLPTRPFAPGKEAAGTVRAVGAGCERLAVGDRVLAIVEHGGYAEQVVAPEDWVIALPAAVSFADAAAVGLVGSTAYLGLVRRGQIRAGETVLVTGAGGGVGSVGLQLAKALGARVIALAHDQLRADVALRLGADVAITSRPDELRADVLEATDGRGVDLVLESLGGDILPQAIRCLAWEGRLVVVGFAAGGQNSIKPGHLLVKNISISGLQSSDYRDRKPALMRAAMDAVLRMLEQGHIDAAVSRTLPLERAADALDLIKAGGLTGKVVLTTAHGRAR